MAANITNITYTPWLLLVEDDPNLRQLVTELLNYSGYTVVSARHGLEALDILRQCATLPGLVLSDLLMPYMDGLQLHMHMHANKAWSSIPYVLLTTEEHIRCCGYEQIIQPDEYLAKPFAIGDILDTVSRLLSRSRALSRYAAQTA